MIYPLPWENPILFLAVIVGKIGESSKEVLPNLG